MDTSEQYIKMCSNRYIQDNHNFRDSDLIAYRGAISLWTETRAFFKGGWFGYHRSRNDYIWLPRQDQLQKMLLGSKHYSHNPVLLQDFYVFVWRGGCKENFSRKAWYDVSMEQLWLAFYMKEKHSRKWDGKEWIKLDKS